MIKEVPAGRISEPHEVAAAVAFLASPAAGYINGVNIPGGDSIRHFVIILLVGIFSGTYSSIFNAAPILVVWENREWTTWFKRKEAAA